MRIFHLYHSGILIETEDRQLFFDPISNISNLLDPRKEIFFFVSHSHSDHFSKSIFSYRNSNIHYILSNDISSKEKNSIILKEDSFYENKDLQVFTYSSTDKGVSFFVKINRYSVLHSGDLNWWHWENDDHESQKQEEINFKNIISKIPDRIDIVFIPVDPRLKDSYYLSAKYLLKTKTISHLIPIHFDSDFEITKKLKDRLKDERIVVVNERNEMVLELIKP